MIYKSRTPRRSATDAALVIILFTALGLLFFLCGIIGMTLI